MKNERIILILLALINFTVIVDFMIIMPLAPLFKRVFSLSPSQWSWVVSAYTFSGAFSGILSVWFADKFDRRKSLLFLYIGFIIGTFLCAQAYDYTTLVAARVFTGAFAGILGAQLYAIVGDLIPMERRGKAIGMISAGFSASAALGVPLGLHLGVEYNWHTPFYAIVGFAIVLFIMCLIYIPSLNAHLQKDTPIIKESLIAPFKRIWDDGNQTMAILFMVLILFGQFSIVPFLSPYMVANVGLQESELRYIYLIGGVLTVFTSPIIGKLADRYGQYTVFSFLLLLSFIPLLVITHLGNVGLMMALIASTMFFVFAGGRMIPATSIVIATAPPAQRGSFMSVRSSVQSFAAGIAAQISGYIIIENEDLTLSNYNWIGYIAVLSGIVAYFIGRKLISRF